MNAYPAHYVEQHRTLQPSCVANALQRGLQSMDMYCQDFVAESLGTGVHQKAAQRPYILRPPPCVFVPALQRREPSTGMYTVEVLDRHARAAQAKIQSLPRDLCGGGTEQQRWRVTTLPGGTRVVEKAACDEVESNEEEIEEVKPPAILIDQPQPPLHYSVVTSAALPPGGIVAEQPSIELGGAQEPARTLVKQATPGGYTIAPTEPAIPSPQPLRQQRYVVSKQQPPSEAQQYLVTQSQPPQHRANIREYTVRPPSLLSTAEGYEVTVPQWGPRQYAEYVVKPPQRVPQGEAYLVQPQLQPAAPAQPITQRQQQRSPVPSAQQPANEAPQVPEAAAVGSEPARVVEEPKQPHQLTQDIATQTQGEVRPCPSFQVRHAPACPPEQAAYVVSAVQQQRGPAVSRPHGAKPPIRTRFPPRGKIQKWEVYAIPYPPPLLDC